MMPAMARAQIVEKHSWSDPEGRIMGYYSAALAFTSIGAPRAEARGLELGLELSFLPPLSEAQRSGGFSKTESTNLMPIVPRPRVAYGMPRGTRFEASYVPPLRVFGVKASLLSAAVSHPLLKTQRVSMTARVAGSSSRVLGPITCNRKVSENGGGDLIFWERVCHGRESEDAFHAPALSVEVLAAGWQAGSVRPYAGLGIRNEQDKFAVGVKNFDGTPDPNHPVLEMSVTRPYGMLGATWMRDARTSLSSELFYAPGSVFTIRFLAARQMRKVAK
jgi:hypothetical protein